MRGLDADDSGADAFRVKWTPMIDLPFAELFGTPVEFAADAKPKRRAPRKAETVLRAVQPNAGIAEAYRKRMGVLISEMVKDVGPSIVQEYRRAPPAMAQDAISANVLRDAIRRMVSKWTKRFDEGSQRLAKWFGLSVNMRSEAALKKILRDAGITIDWRLTNAQRDVLNASIAENVSLIKSIPQQYLGKIEQSVMRSVQAGHDLKTLSDDIQRIGQVTRKRAEFIARDQTRKVTASLSRAKSLDAGITEAIWVHSGGGKEPRPSHVKAGRERQRFSLKDGWYDPYEKQWILPGFLPNCRCVMRPVIKGFTAD